VWLVSCAGGPGDLAGRLRLDQAAVLPEFHHFLDGCSCRGIRPMGCTKKIFL
jgi:hypothetical protein